MSRRLSRLALTRGRSDASSPSRGHRLRLLATAGLGAAAIVGATLTIPSYAGGGGSADALQREFDTEVAARQVRAQEVEERQRLDAELGDVAAFVRKQSGADDGHDHNDPATKNAISRSEESGTAETRDPTTAAQAAKAREVAARQRQEPTPRLSSTNLQAPRHLRPWNRYEMAGGCYGLYAPTAGKWLKRTDTGLAATARRVTGAAGLRFRATRLGTYLLFGAKSDFVNGRSGAVTWAAAPSTAAEWTVARIGSGRHKGRFTLRLPDSSFLRVAKGGAPATTGATGTPFVLERTSGCASYPEVQTNIGGLPYSGTSPFQQVHGMTDAHTHGMAFEFLGGALHCGRPWHKYGPAYALVDCQDHTATGGRAPVEGFLSGDSDFTHDPVGWPTFKDWPAPHSLTHEGTYYKWMERAWRGGLRVFVNLLVENNQLCTLYPLKSQKVLTQNPTCDDMKSAEFQKDDMYALQDYIDAQYGGPGRGWYRIVTNPFEARKVINSGRLAVVMGIETSIPFGCTIKAVLGPRCDKAKIDQQLAMVHKWGARQMELVNKFDNALSGIAGDAGSTGLLVNSANALETGSHWRMETCRGTDPTAEDGVGEVHDNDQTIAPPADNPFPAEQQDALFGAVAMVAGLSIQALPIYPPPHHCNQMGLTDLGEHAIRAMAARGMLFDPDHMSVKARKASLDLVEELKYPGVLSSHSWSTPDAYPRILKLGGFIAPYAGDTTGYVGKWKRTLTWVDERFFFGLGWGADINGLGAQGDPRNPTDASKVTYPFTGLGGVTVGQQRSGERVYDINRDGVSHYGLYPDWLQDVSKVAAKESSAAGRAVVADVARGAEAYLQTWERAVGVRNDSCRQPALAKGRAAFRALSTGDSVRKVLVTMGQPHIRLGRDFRYCSKSAASGTPDVRLTFTAAGRLTRVATG